MHDSTVDTLLVSRPRNWSLMRTSRDKTHQGPTHAEPVSIRKTNADPGSSRPRRQKAIIHCGRHRRVGGVHEAADEASPRADARRGRTVACGGPLSHAVSIPIRSTSAAQYGRTDCRWAFVLGFTRAGPPCPDRSLSFSKEM